MVVPAPSFSRLALAVAVLVTAIELGALFIALSPRARLVKRADAPVVGERVVFVTPAAPRARDAEPRISSAAASRPTDVPPGRPAATLVVPHDSTGASAPSPRISSPREIPPSTGAGVADGVTAVGPALAPRGFNPSAPLTRHIIDSVLESLNARMPALIWARVPTQAERDSAYKESTLAMRLSGRALLVPADPHLVSGLALPSLFSRRRQREAARVRTDSILAENMARLARLRDRARRNAVRRDSLRRADSLSSATPRRPLAARIPA